MSQDNIESELSQWVVFKNKPYSVEIFRRPEEVVWTAEVIDAVEKTKIWQGRSRQEVTALMGALTYIQRYTDELDASKRLEAV